MKNYRYLRLFISLLSFAALNCAFIDISGWGLRHCGWLAKWQFMPAVLSLNFLALAAIILVTCLGGRHYCSWLCPLGIYQDIVARLSHRSGKKQPYTPGPEHRKVRLVSLIVFVALTVCGFLNAACLIDPYGMYGRIAAEIFSPLYSQGNNWLAYQAASQDSYAFASVPLRPHSLFVLTAAILSLIGITVTAWDNGRLYCNTVCPVGTFLGLISSHALCQVRLDEEKCVSCKMCERVCKCGCINIEAKTVDNSRCVVCGRCWQTCKVEGIRYGK